MEKKPVTIYGYELCTSKFMGDRVDIDRFDAEMVEIFLKRIVNDIPLEERAFRKKNKMINLISIKDADDQDFLEGIFTTAKYGKEQVIINIPDQTEAGKKGKDQGVLNEVHFIIDKKTGLLLVENDTEGVARGNFIHSFFKYHKELIYDYISSFNEQFSPVKIYKNNFLKVASLPSKSFFDEIEDFASIKDAYYYKDIKQDTGINNEAANLFYLYQQAAESGVKDITRVKVSFENKLKKGSIKSVKKFFQKLFESQTYDGIGVSGKLPSGRTRTIELENIQRSFDISITYNENGLPSLSELIGEMIKLAKYDNPIHYKRDIQQYEGVKLNGTEENKIS